LIAGRWFRSTGPIGHFAASDEASGCCNRSTTRPPRAQGGMTGGDPHRSTFFTQRQGLASGDLLIEAAHLCRGRRVLLHSGDAMLQGECYNFSNPYPHYGTCPLLSLLPPRRDPF